MDTKNVVVLIGHLVADPELRFTSGGKSVANFSLAVNRSFRGEDGKWHDKLDGYFDCEYFSTAAEKFTEEFKKGSLIQVTGSLHQSKFKVGEAPNERTVSKIEVKVATIGTVLFVPKAKAEVEAPAAAETQGEQLQPA